MNNNYSKPFYLISKDNELINDNRTTIEVAANSGKNGLVLAAPPAVVEMYDVSEAKAIVLALQHFPQYIEKMLFTFRFDFLQDDVSEALVPEAEWKSKAKYHMWFDNMRSLPVLPFFMHDAHVRLAILAGDYLILNKTSITKQEREDGSSRYFIKGGARMELSKRLFNSCYEFMLYCHGSGFDPKPAILSLLKDYSLPVHYIDIDKHYQKNVRNHGAAWQSTDKGGNQKAA